MTERNAFLPVSKATNAYELLDEVKALILEEPKRYDQGVWLVESEEEAAGHGLLLPACGTVACVAGWVVLLKASGTDYDSIQDRARDILGLGWVDSVDLFDGSAIENACDEEDLLGVVEQSPKYAALGARHISSFQAAHEAQLKAKAV